LKTLQKFLTQNFYNSALPLKQDNKGSISDTIRQINNKKRQQMQTINERRLLTFGGRMFAFDDEL